jgi:hypothetical protein
MNSATIQPLRLVSVVAKNAVRRQRKSILALKSLIHLHEQKLAPNCRKAAGRVTLMNLWMQRKITADAMPQKTCTSW